MLLGKIFFTTKTSPKIAWISTTYCKTSYAWFLTVWVQVLHKTHWQYFPVKWCQHLIFFLYNSFNNMFGLLYQSLMLHNIFENRKSLKIWSLRPHEILTLFSKAGSRLPTLCSITSPCFDAVRKHLKRILQTFENF